MWQAARLLRLGDAAPRGRFATLVHLPDHPHQVKLLVVRPSVGGGLPDRLRPGDAGSRLARPATCTALNLSATKFYTYGSTRHKAPWSCTRNEAKPLSDEGPSNRVGSPWRTHPVAPGRRGGQNAGMLRTLNGLLCTVAGLLGGSVLGFVAGILIGWASSPPNPKDIQWPIFLGILGTPVGACIGFVVSLWWLSRRPPGPDTGLEADYRDPENRPPSH
jgi:hypothetical protein